jgi:pentapeptide repeat protein
VERDHTTTRERAVLLLRATFLPRWEPTAGQALVWLIRGAIVLGVFILIASAVDKTLWDWLGLLIVPAVLAIGGYLFNSAQNRATQRAADLRAQDDALQAYLDHMSDMLTPKKDQSSLSDEHPPNSLKSVARARTVTVLARLDDNLKGYVLRFLYESGLINKDRTVLDLEGVDLRGADLRAITLSGANLYMTDLRGANLRLSDLGGANLSWADLGGVNLTLTDLSGADLSWAQDITPEELDQQAYHLTGATMPNGQKYEDWLESKGRGEE